MSDVKIVVMNTYRSLLKRKSRLAGQASALLSIMSSAEGRGISACFRVPVSEFRNSGESETRLSESNGGQVGSGSARKEKGIPFPCGQIFVDSDDAIKEVMTKQDTKDIFKLS